MPGAEGERAGGIVLAAGSSTRMGRNKMLLELDGEPLVRRAVNMAAAAGLTPVICVVGFEADRVRDALDGAPCQVVANPDYMGPSGRSFHAGLRALPADVGTAVVILPDMVHVTADMVRALVASSAATSAPLVVSRYGEVTAPPILFRRSLFPELIAWEGEGCGKPVVKAHAHEAVQLDWPERWLHDLDRPEDLTRLKAVPE